MEMGERGRDWSVQAVRGLAVALRLTLTCRVDQKPADASRADEDDDDASFLPFDPSAVTVDKDGDRDNISPAVRALMNQSVLASPVSPRRPVR